MAITSAEWHSHALKDLELTDMSYEEIAKKYGRDRDTIIKLRRLYKIKRTKKPRVGPKRASEAKPFSSMHRALGIRLTIYRGERNYTSVANELGVSRHVIKYMELGAHDFTLSQLIRLSTILGQNINELVEPHRVLASPRLYSANR